MKTPYAADWSVSVLWWLAWFYFRKKLWYIAIICLSRQMFQHSCSEDWMNYWKNVTGCPSVSLKVCSLNTYARGRQSWGPNCLLQQSPCTSSRGDAHLESQSLMPSANHICVPSLDSGLIYTNPNLCSPSDCDGSESSNCSCHC